MSSSGAEGSVKSLKAQLREAQAEVAKMGDKFGETSIQAQNAAKKAAELKDRIGDAKALTDSFNPDAKFKSFSSAIQGVVGGFTALQGAQALFGVKSEELEKTLLKVQGAMALSQGLNALGEAGDAFKLLGVKAVAAFNSIRTAIGSTGFGVLILAIGAVVTALMDYINESSAAEQATKRMKEEEERYKKSLEETSDEIQRRNQLLDYVLQKDLTNAKAKGASVEELRKIEKDYFKEKIINAQQEEDIARENFERIKLKYGSETEIYKESAKALKDRTSEREKLYQQYYLRLAQFDLEDYEKKQAKGKERDNAEKDRITKANQNKIDLENRLLNAQNDLGIQKQNEQIQNQTNFFNTLGLLSDNYTNNEIQNSKDRIKNIEIEAEHRKAIQEATFGVLDAGAGFLKEIAGKNKAIQKVAIITENAIGIAKQIIANQTANAGALATPQAILTGGASAAPIILRNNIRTALGIATTVAATAKALSALGGGGSASGGGNLPGAGGIGAPIGTQMGGTALQQAQINATGNAAVQAFVLESDVSGNQERIERLNRAARIQ